MRWKKFTLKTTENAEDIVIAVLAGLGIEGVEIEDHLPLSDSDKQKMFVDILPDPVKDDGTALLSFYLEEDADSDKIIFEVRKELDQLRGYVDIGEGSIEESLTEDKDWVNNWKEYFHQFCVEDMLIVPSWEEVKPADRDKLIIHIDPGTAFGTGLHETTQLCLMQLKKFVTKGMEILDVGTGSGILTIAAIKRGAGHATVTDLDPEALSAARENFKANDIPSSFVDLINGNLIDDPKVMDAVGTEKYDIVVANILAEVLVDLTPVIPMRLKNGGIYITSGILKEKEDLVVQAVLNAGLHVVEVTQLNDWVCVTAVKGKKENEGTV